MASAASKIKVIAINDAAYPCWFADIAYCCDKRFWKHHNGFPGFRGIRVSCDDSGFPGIRFLKNTGTQGFDPTPGHVRTGGNSGYQAIHLAIQLGVSKIILVGYDMRGAPQEHWFGKHPDPIACMAMTQANRIRCFAELKPVLDQHGVTILNSSPGSALTFFRHVALEQALEI